MNLIQQKELIKLFKQYQNTNKIIIKNNLKKHMNDAGLKLEQIAAELDISINTIYQIRKNNSSYKPDFMICLLICDLINIPITDIMQVIPDVELKANNSKWSDENKKEFIKDYNSLGMGEVCAKYIISPRTAGEYFRGFVEDVGSAKE